MATYYVYSGATGSNTGGSWANAFISFSSAVSAATTSGDEILIHYTHQEEVVADTYWTFATSVRVISVDKDSADALTPMGTGGWIGHSTAGSYIVQLIGAENTNMFLYGITIRVGGTGPDGLHAGRGQLASWYMESCYFWNGNTNSGTRIYLGHPGTVSAASSTRCRNCTFRFGLAAQSAILQFDVAIEGGSISADGVIPTNGAFENGPMCGTNITFNGFDFSALGANPIFQEQEANTASYNLVNCKLGTGTIFSTMSGTNVAAGEAWLFNCRSNDEHFHLAHYNALGNTTCVISLYANEGALYDGVNHVAWKIQTTANANFYAPYVSPWIDKYHDGVTAVTPSLEFVRNDSTTALTNAEVWGEFTYQGTSGSTICTFAKDRVVLRGTPANQAAGTGLVNWTGPGGTAWSGKLSPTTSVTPAEIGYLRARVLLAKPSTTIYVDPMIRT